MSYQIYYQCCITGVVLKTGLQFKSFQEATDYCYINPFSIDSSGIRWDTFVCEVFE